MLTRVHQRTSRSAPAPGLQRGRPSCTVPTGARHLTHPISTHESRFDTPKTSRRTKRGRVSIECFERRLAWVPRLVRNSSTGLSLSSLSIRPGRGPEWRAFAWEAYGPPTERRPRPAHDV